MMFGNIFILCFLIKFSKKMKADATLWFESRFEKLISKTNYYQHSIGMICINDKSNLIKNVTCNMQ